MTGVGRARRRRPRAAAVLALLLAWPVAAGGSGTEPETGADLERLRNVPMGHRAYAPGEYLLYGIAWTGIPAGQSSMSVVAGKDAEGDPVHWLVSVTRSARGLSLVYPVRDRIVSQVDAESGLPERIDIDQHHGKRDRVRSVVFDQAARRATTFQEGRDPVTVETPPRVQDILSVLYYVRGRDDLEPGRTVEVDVHEGKKNWTLLAHVERRERVGVVAGTFDTLRVKAEVQFEGVFFDRGEVFLWLSDDARHIPVMVTIKIPLGRVVAELREMALPPLAGEADGAPVARVGP